LCLLKQRVAAFIDEESNRIPLHEQLCFHGEKDNVFPESAEQIGSVESTHVLKDSFKVGTVTGGPLRLRNVGTLSHVQPLRNEGSER